MRGIFWVMLAFFSISVFASSDDENVTVRNVNNQYVINYYNYNEDVAAYFAKAGLQGGGYTWEALVKAAVKTESPDFLPQIEFSPEGGTFIAYTASDEIANKLKTIIKKLSSDVAYRGKNLKIASDGGYIE